MLYKQESWYGVIGIASIVNNQKKDPGGDYEPALTVEGVLSVQWMAIHKKRDIVVTLKWYLKGA